MQPAAVTLHPESTVCGGIVSYIEGNILSFHKIKPIHSLVDDAESIRIKSLRGAGCNIRILGLRNRVEQDDWSQSFMLEKKSVGSRYVVIMNPC